MYLSPRSAGEQAVFAPIHCHHPSGFNACGAQLEDAVTLQFNCHVFVAGGWGGGEVARGMIAVKMDTDRSPNLFQ